MGKSTPSSIRLAELEDLDFLRRMLFEAFFWRVDQLRPDYADFAIANLEFQKLLANWGGKGDTAVIAEVDGQAIGAAWYRFWTDEVHSYGFVDTDTPEIGIGVRSEWRRRGVGQALLHRLLREAQRQGVHQISLSVEVDNPARQLYERLSFVRLSEVGNAWTMVKKFS